MINIKRSTPTVSREIIPHFDRKGKYSQKRTRESTILKSKVHLGTSGSRVWPVTIFKFRSKIRGGPWTGSTGMVHGPGPCFVYVLVRSYHRVTRSPSRHCCEAMFPIFRQWKTLDFTRCTSSAGFTHKSLHAEITSFIIFLFLRTSVNLA